MQLFVSFSVSESSATEQCGTDIIITNRNGTVSNGLKSHWKLAIRDEAPSEIRNSGVWYVDMAGKVLQDITRDGSGGYKKAGLWGFTYIHTKGRPSKNIHFILRTLLKLWKLIIAGSVVPMIRLSSDLFFMLEITGRCSSNIIVGINYISHSKNSFWDKKITVILL